MQVFPYKKVKNYSELGPTKQKSTSASIDQKDKKRGKKRKIQGKLTDAKNIPCPY